MVRGALLSARAVAHNAIEDAVNVVEQIDAIGDALLKCKC